MSDTDDLKELVQKAAEGDRAALEKLDTLEDAEKFKLQLYRIAVNKSINRLKKMRPILPGDERLEGMKPEDNENFLPEEYALNAARAKIKEGVLQYEKKSGDKLRSVAAAPFLAALFTTQMESMQMPSLPLSILDALPESTFAATSAKTGGSILFKSLQFKIAIGIAAAVVTVGGVATAAVLINRNAKEVSVEGQKENGLEKTTPETDEETVTEDSITVEEVTSEAIEEATEPAVEPATEPQPQYTYSDMNVTMYAKSSVNVRNLPSADGERLGSLSTNQEITVTGQCNETGWYRFEYNGSVAYVSNNYLSDTKVEQTTDASGAQASANNSASNSNFDESDPNIMLHNELIAKCGIGVWNDFGDWMVYVSPVDPLTISYLEGEGANRVKEETRPSDRDEKINILASRYPERHATSTYSKSLHNYSYQVVVWFVYTQPVPQELKDFFYKYTEDGRRFPGWFNGEE